MCLGPTEHGVCMTPVDPADPDVVFAVTVIDARDNTLQHGYFHRAHLPSGWDVTARPDRFDD